MKKKIRRSSRRYAKGAGFVWHLVGPVQYTWMVLKRFKLWIWSNPFFRRVIKLFGSFFRSGQELIFPSFYVRFFFLAVKSSGLAEFIHFCIQVTGHKHGLIATAFLWIFNGIQKTGLAISFSSVLSVGGNVFNQGIGAAPPGQIGSNGNGAGSHE